MSVHAKLAVVRVAEADCAIKRADIGASWRGFKQEAGLAATPGRVIVAGLVAGFLAGLPRLGAGTGSLLGGKLVEMLMDGAFANLGAAIAAGAAMANAESPPAATAAAAGDRQD
ncbi:MAG TPA: hypothetical protein VGH80_15140 [Xanthomonadaceae bacterium]|jgi:hypothetical protein